MEAETAVSRSAINAAEGEKKERSVTVGRPPRKSISIESAVANLLACPTCKQPLTLNDISLRCTKCEFKGEFSDDVVIVEPRESKSFFDDKFHVMEAGHKSSGEFTFCYNQQIRLLQQHLKPGMTVLEVGCGPSLPYVPPQDCTMLGLEYSFGSIRVNKDVDLRIFGSATRIPLRDHSVDVVVCFYAIHHIVGKNRAETTALVNEAFKELGRVIKKGGYLFVFEMTPSKPVGFLEKTFWNLGKAVLGAKLDMFFWPANDLDEFGKKYMPSGVLERIYFPSSPFLVFPPIFALQRLKIIRLLYPLDARLYKWVF